MGGERGRRDDDVAWRGDRNGLEHECFPFLVQLQRATAKACFDAPNPSWRSDSRQQRSPSYPGFADGKAYDVRLTV